MGFWIPALAGMTVMQRSPSARTTDGGRGSTDGGGGSVMGGEIPRGVSEWVRSAFDEGQVSRACFRSSNQVIELARSQRHKAETAYLLVVYRSICGYGYACRHALLPRTEARGLLKRDPRVAPTGEVERGGWEVRGVSRDRRRYRRRLSLLRQRGGGVI